MKKLIVAFLLSLTSFLAHAQKDYDTINKPVLCSSLKTIITAVTKEFQELPVWRGSDDRSRYIMTVNQKTGTWTMIQYNEEIACVIGAGESSKFIAVGKTV